jgi:hypothetical protein
MIRTTLERRELGCRTLGRRRLACSRRLASRSLGRKNPDVEILEPL